jgi:Spy/CpxP family protein refolding chaperone
MAKNVSKLFVVLLLIVGVATFSGCRRHSHAHKAEFMVDYISETLDLNESQKEQLNQIKDEVMGKAKQMHADKEVMREELLAQLKSEAIDTEVVKEMVAKHRARMDEIIDLLVESLAEFHKTLTPEQKDKLVAKIETFKKWHGSSWE